MALLAESLVEEWLNRDGFFTIRGVKHGVGEMDLLAIRQENGTRIVGWHVEVQVSFRPVGYVAKLTDDLIGDSGRSPTSAKERTAEEIDVCAREWARSKFQARKKARVRDKLWPGVVWEYHFVYGVLRDPRELDSRVATWQRWSLTTSPTTKT